MIELASALPNSNDGYVAAAYIVFFAIVLIYVAIMAVRLTRVERKLSELRAEGRDERSDTSGTNSRAGEHATGRGVDAGTDGARERERV